MEVLPTIDEIVDEIVAELNWPNYDKVNGVDIGGLRAYKWPNWVELKHGEGQNQNVVQREFKNDALWVKLNSLFWKIKSRVNWLLRPGNIWIASFLDAYDLPLDQYTLPTVHEAVKACLMKLDELNSDWISPVTNARPW